MEDPVETLLDASGYATSLRPLSHLTGMGSTSEYVVKMKAQACKVINTGPRTELHMQYKTLQENTAQ